MRQEGVYTPTPQEGAPRRGDGSGPSRWVGSARAVGGCPTPEWGGRVITWNQAASSLRLSLAMGAARAVLGDPPSPPHR